MGHKREDWRIVEYTLTEEDIEKMWKDHQQEKEKEEWKTKNLLPS